MIVSENKFPLTQNKSKILFHEIITGKYTLRKTADGKIDDPLKVS